jgi:hypothetical protein
MASIHKELSLAVSADQAWAALRLVGEVHKLFAGVLVDGHLDGDLRTVKFANGMVVRERIIDVDEARRRVVYSVVEGTPMTHHNASMQILDEGAGRCRFIWISDFLPAEFAGTMAPMVEQGAQALKANLETGH